MSPAKRRGFSGWLSRLKGYQLILGFVISAAVAGTAILGSIGKAERTYGIVASHFGWARSTEVSDSFSDLKQWQLYSDIRRLKRAIFDIGTPQTDRHRELLDDLTTQLVTVQAEYDRISKKARR